MVRILYILLLLPQLLLANMASPFVDGTRAGSPFLSRNIDVLSEHIGIRLFPDRLIAHYTIDYIIETPVSGKQLPLLFVAFDYEGAFTIWVDGKKATARNIPENILHFKNSAFSAFQAGPVKSSADWYDEVNINWGDNHPQGNYRISDLKYFEADLTKGRHTIRISYDANPDRELWGWVSSCTFRYSLSPVKYWNSFGNLSVTIVQEGEPVALTTNLGKSVQTGNTQRWSFKTLPADVIQIDFEPRVSPFANVMIAIGPLPIALAISILIIWFHIWWIKNYRKKRPHKKFSVPVILGSILFPLFFFIAHILSFPLIDLIIGPYASGRHGYLFLIIFLYPIVMPLYWICMWIVDHRFKKRLNRHA